MQTSTLDGNGSGRFGLDFGPANSVPRRLAAELPSWVSQGLVVKSGPGGLVAEFTNVFTMRPRKGFAGSKLFKHAHLHAKAPLTIARTKGSRTLYVRNDGHGIVQVREYAGAVALPGVSTVNDRAAMRIPLRSTTTKVVLSTRVTLSTPQHPGVSVLSALDY